MNLTDLTPGELYELGEHIATTSRERPDVSHPIFLGMKHKYEEMNWPECSLFGEVLWALWRHRMYVVKANLRIPFGDIQKAKAPSGSGNIPNPP